MNIAGALYGQAIAIEDVRYRQDQILKAIASHCDAYGITYYVYKGTLLGAVRHGGWIPWDDDIDIALPRADYERFCKTFPSASPTNTQYSLRSETTDPSYAYPFAKVSDDQTLLDAYSDVNPALGVFVDVFPLDGWRDDPIGRFLQRAGYRILRQLLRIKRLKIKNVQSVSRRRILRACKILLRPLCARTISKGITWLAMLGSFDETTHGGDLVWHREKVPRVAYGTPTRVTFEGTEYSGPRDYNEVLRCLYGDYLTLPPLEGQVRRHKFDAYVRIPAS